MSNKVVFGATLFSILFSLHCNSKKKIVLVNQGRAACQIVLPKTASAIDQQAAAVLRNYLKQITGVTISIETQNHLSKEFPTKIYIGTSGAGQAPAIPLKRDGFVIETDDQNLYMYGGAGKGTLYSVYTFLDQYLHCKKPAGNEKAITPKTSNLSVNTGIRDVQNPAFQYRQSFYPASTDPEYLDWHKLQNFEDWGLWGHSLFKIIPPETYFQQHPEYFALIDGSRQPTQLCLSNPDVFQRTVQYLKKAFQNRPDAIYWSISQMDNSGYCTCPACSAVDRAEGGPQGSVIHFVNKIAAQFPNKEFVTLAYRYSANPPRHTQPAENVYILLSNIEVARSKPMAESASARAFRSRLKAWHKITDRIFIWDYTTQFTNYLCPFPTYTHVFADAAFLLDNGVKGIFFQGSGNDFSDMAALNSYLQARALWQPEQPADSLKKRFFKALFGKAADPISAYVNALNKAVNTTHTTLRIYGNPVNNRVDYLSPAYLDTYSRYLDKAEALTENDPLRYRHVERVRLGLEYVVLQQALAYGTRKHGYLVADTATGTFVVSPKWRDRIDRFYATAKRLGIRKLGETGPDLEHYYQHWQEVFARGWTKNPASMARGSLAFPYSTDYPANRITTLVDGLQGSLDYSYNWLLFYGNDLLLSLDFSTEKNVHKITVGCLYDPRHHLYLPEAIQVSTSSNGKTYRVIATQKIPRRIPSGAAKRIEISIPANSRSRYYRVRAICPTTVKDGTLPDGKKPAIAIDEVRL